MGRLTLTFGDAPPKLVQSEFEHRDCVQDLRGNGRGTQLVKVHGDFQWRAGEGLHALAILLIRAVLWGKSNYRANQRFIFNEDPAEGLYEPLRRHDRPMPAWATTIFGYIADHTGSGRRPAMISEIIKVSRPGGKWTAELQCEVLPPTNIRIIWRQNGEDISSSESRLTLLINQLIGQYSDASQEEEVTPHSELPAELVRYLDIARTEEVGPREFLVPFEFGLGDVLKGLRSKAADRGIALVDVKAGTAVSQPDFWKHTFDQVHDFLGRQVPALPADWHEQEGREMFKMVKRLLDETNCVLLLHELDQMILTLHRQGQVENRLKPFYAKIFNEVKRCFVFGTMGLKPVLNYQFSGSSTVAFNIAVFKLSDNWDEWVEHHLRQLLTRPSSSALESLLSLSEKHPRAFLEGLAQLDNGNVKSMAQAIERVHASVADRILSAVPETMRLCLVNGDWNRTQQAEIARHLFDAHILREVPKSSGSKGCEARKYQPVVKAWQTTWTQRRSGK
jgi:hypothetical protein